MRAHAPLPLRSDRARSPRRLRFATLASLALAALVGCQGLDPTPETPEPTDAERARFVRMRLEDARSFKAQGRLDSAAAAAQRALAVAPDDVRGLRFLAGVESARGHDDEAQRLRARADALDPPTNVPPDSPLVANAASVLTVLVPPAVESPRFEAALAGEWPERAVPATLAARLRTRLPNVGVTELTPASVAQARAWLRARDVRLVVSLQVERASCGESVKDGAFALAQLRVAASTPVELVLPPTDLRELESDPVSGPRCVERALARALERALALPSLRAALEGGGAPGGADGPWPSRVVRPLFPVLGARIAWELERGRARLAVGRLGDAEESFRRAESVDPDDPDTQAYLSDVRSTLQLAKELDAQPGRRGGALRAAAAEGVLDVTLAPEARAAAESQLEDERRRRDELLTALALASGEELAQTPALLASLRPVDLPEEGDVGLGLARAEARGEVTRRAFFGPDGKRLAAYFLDASGAPVLREEDRDGDGTVDRWTAYDHGRRSEVWEARDGSSVPTAHFLLAPNGAVSKIEVLRPSDGRAQRVFTYDGGRLSAEASDTNGDGQLDRFEKFDADGEVASREEDLNGDGEMDVRSRYEKGRLIRREITDPDLVEGLLGKGATR